MFIQTIFGAFTRYIIVRESVSESIDKFRYEYRQINFAHFPFSLIVYINENDRRNYKKELIFLVERFVYLPFVEAYFFYNKENKAFYTPDYFNFDNKFIDKKEVKGSYLIGVKDNYDLNLNMFYNELHNLKINNNTEIYVYLNYNDRVYFRYWIVKLFDLMNDLITDLKTDLDFCKIVFYTC